MPLWVPLLLFSISSGLFYTRLTGGVSFTVASVGQVAPAQHPVTVVAMAPQSVAGSAVEGDLALILDPRSRILYAGSGRQHSGSWSVDLGLEPRIRDLGSKIQDAGWRVTKLAS